MTDLALRAAAEGGVYLCLLWPARLDSIVPIHALAALEMNMTKDLKGLRTLLFPGSHASRSGLNAWLLDRAQLAALYRALWVVSDTESRLACARPSESMLAVLAALNDIEIRDQSLPHPSMGEAIPTFIFDHHTKEWCAPASTPLERSMRKVGNVRYRKELRKRSGPEWGDPMLAPDALMVVHNSARKDHWKAVLRHRSFAGDARPELFLYDASSASDQRNYAAVRRIPEFLRVARENGYANTGALIMTDDPRTFFTLRARIGDLHTPFVTEVLPAEADDVLLSQQALPADWHPAQKSNSNFTVAVVDRDASSIALTFYRLASDLGDDDAPGYKQLLDACLYILRLSSMPAGYRDLTAATAEGELDEFTSNRYAWATIEQALRAVLAVGTYGARKVEVEEAILKARRLVDHWQDATPMAGKLLAAVRKFAVDSRVGVVIVLPNQRYIKLAHRYLARTLGDSWAAAEPRTEWQTLTTAARSLGADRSARHFVFVGVNRNVLRILLAHPDVPHGTSLFIAYRQAESTLVTLRGMKELQALKPYRGRIGLLIQELERRLGEIPNPLRIERLGEMSLTFSLDERSGIDPTTEQSYYRFDLEGGGRAYRSGWVYRYEPDEDPFFRRTLASQIEVGDLIFDMGDTLRGKIEAALQINSGDLTSVVHPERAFLNLYHQDVQRRSAALFTAPKRSTLARQIHARMVELDAKAKACRPGRIYYWLDLSGNDTKPHAAKDATYFKIFCRALELDDETTLKYWNFIKNARRLNQNIGRALAAQYAEILFQPESASIYRRIPADIVHQLQREALRCVFRVEGVLPPDKREA